MLSQVLSLISLSYTKLHESCQLGRATWNYVGRGLDSADLYSTLQENLLRYASSPTPAIKNCFQILVKAGKSEGRLLNGVGPTIGQSWPGERRLLQAAKPEVGQQNSLSMDSTWLTILQQVREVIALASIPTTQLIQDHVLCPLGFQRRSVRVKHDA